MWTRGIQNWYSISFVTEYWRNSVRVLLSTMVNFVLIDVSYCSLAHFVGRQTSSLIRVIFQLGTFQNRSFFNFSSKKDIRYLWFFFSPEKASYFSRSKMVNSLLLSFWIYWRGAQSQIQEERKHSGRVESSFLAFIHFTTTRRMVKYFANSMKNEEEEG